MPSAITKTESATLLTISFLAYTATMFVCGMLTNLSRSRYNRVNDDTRKEENDEPI